MTLDDFRKHFWRLGPGKPGSHIIAFEGTNVTVKVLQTTWNRRTGSYEDAGARDFAALGFTVTWVSNWRDDMQAQIDEGRVCREEGTVLRRGHFRRKEAPRGGGMTPGAGALWPRGRLREAGLRHPQNDQSLVLSRLGRPRMIVKNAFRSMRALPYNRGSS
jgi:hypothetical protein